MCGISGIINKRGGAVDPVRIEQLTDPTTHGGTDGHGHFFGPNFPFGHRRLSIIDLSERVRQPMACRDRSWITYNGEIYNYLEIRAELARLGCTFVSVTDTEVILAADAHWGPDCLRGISSMWAFAIYDAERQEIFFARDRFGVKPLYYTDSAEHYTFGSEIKQLLVGHSSTRANRGIMVEARCPFPVRGRPNRATRTLAGLDAPLCLSLATRFSDMGGVRCK